MTTLDSLTDGLARALAALDEEDTLILSRSTSYLSDGRSNRFVQFALFAGNLRAESVGDRYLEGSDMLTPGQRAALADLGWSPPDSGGNYWREWSAPPPYVEIATFALATLGQVHGVEHEEQLDFDASEDVLSAIELSDAGHESTANLAASVTRHPGIRHLAYWDYDRDGQVVCPACGWSGRAGSNQTIFEDFLDVRCGACDAILLIVDFPTLAETREAAAAGNARAQADLPDIEAQAAWRARAASTLLSDPAQLPDLIGDELTILWDFEVIDGERWQVLRHGELAIWREVAFYESYERFREVFEILHRRYGDRLQEVRPSPASELWLYGDRLGAPGIIDALNRSLRTD